MSEITLEEFERSLTECQRAIIECFTFEWDCFTVKDFQRESTGKPSLNTVRRALAKLCDMGALVRIPAAKKGRGYSHQYKLSKGQ